MCSSEAVVFLGVFLVMAAGAEPVMRTCEPIRVDICSGLGYNLTGMPNLAGNDLQQEAEYIVKSYSPLIQYGCSSQLRLFLCSVYIPMCTEKVLNPIGPCRSLCESVKSKCYPVLQGFGFIWPEGLNCSLFPVKNNHEHMCMEGPKNMDRTTSRPVKAVRKTIETCVGDYHWNSFGMCVPKCHGDNLFDDSARSFAEVWLTVWALICLILSLASALTLIIGGGRVKARPLISLALCYFMVALGWALRIFFGRASTCRSSILPDDVLEDGLSNVNCAFVFILLYYFGMAANAWWVCLCGWWVARAALGWPPKKLRTFGSILHLCAWGLPAAQTVVALVRREADADDLTGTCYIGNSSTSTLLFFVLLPQVFYFVFGVALLGFGCIYVLHKPRTTAAVPLTATAPRKESDFLGTVCTLYTIPTFCVLASVYYEYKNRDSWLRNESKPVLWAFLLKHLMSLFIGVSTVFWIWSVKTITAWRAVFRRMGPRKPLPVKVETVPVLKYPSAHNSLTNSLTSGLSSGSSSRHSNRLHPHNKKLRIHHIRNGGGTII